MKTISVIYSFRNEQLVLDELCRRTLGVIDKLKGYKFEIIFVNDDSTDSSLKILQDHVEKDTRIKIINTKSRCGQLASIWAGFKESTGDSVIYLDSDLQDPPEIFPEIIEKWEEGFEIVHTVRRKREGESKLKMLLTSLAYWIISKTSSIKIPQNAGDFKLVDRKVLDILLSNFAEESPYYKGLIPSISSKQCCVEYDREKRFDGQTHFPILKGEPVESFFIGWTAFSTFPLYLPFVFFMFFLTLSLVLIGVILANPGFINFTFIELTLFGLLVLIGLSILLSLGLIGAYIARIHLQTRNRPLYLKDR